MAGADSDVGQNVLLYVFACLYLLGLFVLGAVAHRRKERATATAGALEGHFGGSFGAPALVLTTFSTVYSGFTVTGIPSEAFRKGFFSLRWVGATLVIVVAMLFFYPRLRRLAVERKYQSPNDFVTDRYRSKRLRLLCAACAVVPLLIYMTAQIVSFAAMMSGLTFGHVPKWASMLAFAVLTLVLEKLGGMNSVVLTDAVQSIIMIASFLAVPWVLGADFGFLAQIAGAECPSLEHVRGNGTECPATEPGCVASGCLAAVRPEFYEYPSRVDQAQIFWFFFNILAASLQPHMVQRAYIAASDQALRVVMAAMLFAPFLAQPPGIVIGLTKAAFDPAWPAADREATAFSGLSNQLMAKGPFEYFLVTVMTCSVLAAIMSTADSALMGASSIMSMDVFKGWLRPSASSTEVIRVGEANSLLMMIGAVLLGLNMSVSQFGSLIVFQNGMLMQLLPTYGFGLFFDVRAPALEAGMACGLLLLVVMAAAGNPLDPYVPLVNVSFLANFLTAAATHVALLPGGSAGGAPASKGHEDGAAFGQQPPLSLKDIRDIMAPSTEPNRGLLGVMLVLMVLSVPFYREPGVRELVIWGLPLWGFVQCLLFLTVFCLGLATVFLWAPRGRASGSYASETESTETEESSGSAERSSEQAQAQ